jgi:hypothetical protein
MPYNPKYQNRYLQDIGRFKYLLAGHEIILYILAIIILLFSFFVYFFMHETDHIVAIIVLFFLYVISENNRRDPRVFWGNGFVKTYYRAFVIPTYKKSIDIKDITSVSHEIVLVNSALSKINRNPDYGYKFFHISMKIKGEKDPFIMDVSRVHVATIMHFFRYIEQYNPGVIDKDLWDIANNQLGVFNEEISEPSL